MSWSSIGTLGANTRARGTFDATETYSRGDLVTHDGLVYQCSADVAPRLVEDSFVRPDQSGWGVSSGGLTWSGTGSEQEISSDYGVSHEGFTATLAAWPPSDRDIVVSWKSSIASTQGSVARLLSHYSDNGNYFELTLGENYAELNSYTEGVYEVVCYTPFASYSDDVVYGLHWRIRGNHHSVRYWDAADPEPETWLIQGDASAGHVPAGTGAVGLSGGPPSGQTVSYSAYSVDFLLPYPADDPDHWVFWAAGAPPLPGAPTMIGPYVIDYTDFGPTPMDGHTVGLWTPVAGDVVLAVVIDPSTYVSFGGSAAGLRLGQDTTTDESSWVSDSAVVAPSNITLPHLGGIRIVTSADPVHMRYVANGDGDLTAGHVEFYALVARAVAP